MGSIKGQFCKGQLNYNGCSNESMTIMRQIMRGRVVSSSDFLRELREWDLQKGMRLRDAMTLPVPPITTVKNLSARVRLMDAAYRKLLKGEMKL